MNTFDDPSLRLPQADELLRDHGHQALDLNQSYPMELPPDDEETTARIPLELTTDLEANADTALEALAQAPNLYTRGGVLVHLVRDHLPDKDGIQRPTSTPRITQVPSARLMELVSTHAEVMARSGRKQELGPAVPPMRLIRVIEGRGEWPELRPLVAVVEAPTQRPDGSILEQPGYDRWSGIYLAPNLGHVPVLPWPERKHAEIAALDLLEVVEDFPFTTEAHAAAWVAGLLTVLAMHAFDGPAPMLLIDANCPGAGKSLLADLISLIAFGRPCPRTVMPERDDEMRKRITSIALAGDPLVLLDNIDHGLGGAALDAALTARTWRERLLNTNDTIELPLHTIWMATGNNVEVIGDTMRRILHVRLESPEERPEERGDFRHPDLTRWVLEQRPRLVAAGLNILSAYTIAGRPDLGLKRWGSFEAWSDLVRNAVVWAGLPDPAETRHELRAAADVEGAALRQLLLNWDTLDPGGRGLTASGILQRLRSGDPALDEVRAAIDVLAPGRGGDLPSPRSLGRKLGKFRARLIAGRVLQATSGRMGLTWTATTTQEGS
ncbi:MAG: hypothetical protein H6716_29015 [Polyangiaceae bacterium]|nr:hypothetical protein [Polyangiaceae bacterium]